MRLIFRVFKIKNSGSYYLEFQLWIARKVDVLQSRDGARWLSRQLKTISVLILEKWWIIAHWIRIFRTDLFQTFEEGAAPREGIFSSLANVICCAFQALPSVLTQFLSSINRNEPSEENRQTSGSFGRHRRQRRRSATFTPYAPQSENRRRFNQRNNQPLSPLPIVKFLRSPRPSRWFSRAPILILTA